MLNISASECHDMRKQVKDLNGIPTWCNQQQQKLYLLMSQAQLKEHTLGNPIEQPSTGHPPGYHQQS